MVSIIVPRVSLDAEAIAGSVSDARRRIVAFAAELGADRDLQARVALAVSEAATNVVVHAYPDAGPRPLQVAADFEEGGLDRARPNTSMRPIPGQNVPLRRSLTRGSQKPHRHRSAYPLASEIGYAGVGKGKQEQD